MLKLTRDEINKTWEEADVFEDESEWDEYLVAKGAQHAAEEIYRFVKDWELLLEAEFEAKYGKKRDWPWRTALKEWLKFQGVELSG